jgi:hypothetical protein
MRRAASAFDADLDDDAAAELVTEAAELRRMTGELAIRIRSLYSDVDGWVGGPTADQQAQMRYFTELVGQIRDRLAAIAG